MAIRVVKTPYFFAGQGRILISDRSESGAPVGYKDIGKVSKVDLLTIARGIDHFDSCGSEGKRDAIYELDAKTDIEIAVDHIDPENIALFYRGDMNSIEAATLYKEVVRVFPGFLYCSAYIQISNVVVMNEEETIIYENHLNYEVVDGATGVIQILKDQTGAAHVISAGQDIQIMYDYVDQQHGIPMMHRKEYCLRFEGMNTAEGDLPVVLECFRVSQNLVQQLAYMSSVVVQTVVTAALLKDPTRDVDNQFFREMFV